MSEKNNKHYNSLELNKILEMLSGYTTCDDAREMAVNIVPETRLERVERLLCQTKDAHMLMARFGAPNFGSLSNVNNAVTRAQSGGCLNMSELLKVAETLRVIRSLSQWRERCEGVKTEIDGYFNALMPNKFLEEKINSAIISEDEMADNASPELADIRRKMRSVSANVREQLDKMTRSQHYQKALQEPIVTMRNGRFVVPVRNEHRAEVQGLVHDTSSSGATVFIEPIAVVEANNQIKVLQSKERDEIERILAELSAQTGEFAGGIKSSYENAVMLNLIFAKAQLAYKMKASVPTVNDEGIINLKKARHPLIDEKKVVATDITLGKDFDTLVITGPNTGGKTVSIKTIGLLTLMTMCGLMIPVADMSEISVFDYVLADIGDEQSIEQSLSTFSAHMTNIIDILSVANDKSLILIDELGAGTDPVEGAALAMAILEKLHFQGAKIAATTHYAELKAYALQTLRVENGSCEFDVKTLRPTYRLLIGVPGRSNAFAISSRLGMDNAIIERAKELVSSENTRFEEVVESLEKSRQELEKEIDRNRLLNKQAQEHKLKAKQNRDSIDELREKELEKARNEASHIVEKARREAFSLMEEINKLKKEQAKTKDAAELARRAKQTLKKGLDSIDDAANPVFERYIDENYVLERPLRVGDEIIIADMGTKAEVVELPDKNDNVLVQAGLMKTRVALSNIRLIGEKKKKEQPKTRNVKNVQSRSEMKVETSLDLRGMNVEEAIVEIDRFLDSATLAGVNEVTVIHGKGTGALRAGVQAYLKKHLQVKSFRNGVFGEGENGVTVVTLK
ncbi:MAG: endonuclease MutS2 [Clostridiales bacterium]|nr:endonuclease MutS2 [Clostridiales bacterium]